VKNQGRQAMPGNPEPAVLLPADSAAGKPQAVFSTDLCISFSQNPHEAV
jgi:hypothetical protein